MRKAYEFVAVVHQGEGRGYVASFPDFPGCRAFALTENGAIDMAVDVLADHLAKMHQADETIPTPLTIIEVLSDPRWSDDLTVLVLEVSYTDGPGRPAGYASRTLRARSERSLHS